MKKIDRDFILHPLTWKMTVNNKTVNKTFDKFQIGTIFLVTFICTLTIVLIPFLVFIFYSLAYFYQQKNLKRAQLVEKAKQLLRDLAPTCAEPTFINNRLTVLENLCEQLKQKGDTDEKWILFGPFKVELQDVLTIDSQNMSGMLDDFTGSITFKFCRETIEAEHNVLTGENNPWYLLSKLTQQELNDCMKTFEMAFRATFLSQFPNFDKSEGDSWVFTHFSTEGQENYVHVAYTFFPGNEGT